MSGTFEGWNERIAAANDELERRKLIGELGMWRAAHLTDIVAMRSAAFAMSRLYMLVGDRASAVREAESLMSLCRTAPEATKDELKRVRAYLKSLGLVISEKGEVVERKKSSPSDPKAEVAQLIRSGDFRGASKLLRGKKGPSAMLFRVWLELDRVSKNEDASDLRVGVEQLLERLGNHLEILKKTPAKPREAKIEVLESKSKPESMESDRLAEWMGVKSLPRKREARLRTLEKYLVDHPDQLDELVAVALATHVEQEGLKRTAPWLTGLVARALIMAPAGKTHAMLGSLGEQGSYAVTAYSESGALRGIDLLRHALENGWTYEGFRRGVLRDNRVDSMKVWTVRLRKGDVQRMVAVTPGEVVGLENGLRTRLLESVKRLCASSLIWTDSAGEGLAAESKDLGLGFCDSDDPAEVLRQLAELPIAAEVSPRASRSPLAQALRQQPLPSVDDLVALVREYRRTYQCFQSVRGLSQEGLEDEEVRLARLLEAAHRVAPEHARLNEGMTIVLSYLAISPEGAIAQLLEDPAILNRFGGPGVLEVGGLGTHWSGAGWTLRRAVQGVTRRERDNVPALETQAEGLWRLVLENNGREVELWYLPTMVNKSADDLEVILPDNRGCAVLFPSDAEPPAWHTKEGVRAVRWSGVESEALESVLAG